MIGTIISEDVTVYLSSLECFIKATARWLMVLLGVLKYFGVPYRTMTGQISVSRALLGLGN